MAVTASVVLEKTAYSFDKPYDYLIPEALRGACKAGCRVIVPFGRGNSERQGMVLCVHEVEYSEQLKNVSRVVDDEPVLSEEMLKLCEWLHETLFCTYFDAVNTVLPAGISFKITDSYCADDNFKAENLTGEEKVIFDYLKFKGVYVGLNKILSDCNLLKTDKLSSLVKKGAILKNTEASKKIGDAKQKCIEATVTFEQLQNIKLTPKQSAAANILLEKQKISVKQLVYLSGVSVSVLESLVKKGVGSFYEQRVFRKPTSVDGKTEANSIILTAEQKAAYEKLSSCTSGSTALLYGITGSGKTQVYLKLVDDAIKNNKGVIIMVPEISLTPQAVSLFGKRYGDKIAIFHSAMSAGERKDEWQRVKMGIAKIAIGTRSAVFAPLSNIGLIIMDEEQEHTYKSEQSPRFHARDIAKFRAKYHNALFLMASATPSIETYTRALSGKIELCKLTERYGNAVLPETEIVDMRTEIQNGNTGAVSNSLYSEISSALENKKQAIVLLNRRGHNTYVSCPACGTALTCPNCSVSLTYHSANKSLMCHYCGFTRPVPNKCDACDNTRLKFSGFGTQKVEEELNLLFPEAKILRLDADSTVNKDSYHKYLNAFSAGEYDIMLGTQMVAKGLDFPNVTVVGIIGADKSLNSEDYRSTERTFSLLTQVIGRAGRGDFPGKAIIQTTDPDNSIIPLAQSQDYDAFYREEIMMRKALTYPPYCDLVSVVASSQYKPAAENSIISVLNNVRSLVSGEFNDVAIIVLGPSAASVAKINNKYRYRLLIKCKNNKRLREMLRKAVDFKYEKDTSVIIDINPEAVL